MRSALAPLAQPLRTVLSLLAVLALALLSDSRPDAARDGARFATLLSGESLSGMGEAGLRARSAETPAKGPQPGPLALLPAPRVQEVALALTRPEGATPQDAPRPATRPRAHPPRAAPFA
ncbi:MAG TPA: hypothetical protein DD444_20585 [Citreicella sp.]|jgi:hypothetical protein|nr:hypothetical protein [Citreicella sp.]|tara:strand:- start:39 stop:398 length:360 start_codon:yes stop_codon:yes gene_type:complete